jgi:hypothetical protein
LARRWCQLAWLANVEQAHSYPDSSQLQASKLTS